MVVNGCKELRLLWFCFTILCDLLKKNRTILSTVLFASVVIGQSDYFGFTTLTVENHCGVHQLNTYSIC